MTGKVRAVSFPAPGITDIRIEAAWKDAAPGRFVHCAVPGFSLRRPISLCGYENGVARLVFAVKGGGTAALAALKPGDETDLLGPLGNGFPEPKGKTVLVGGGMGLPPLLYYAKTYGGLHTIAGCRTNGQVVLTQEFPSVEVCIGEDYPHERLRRIEHADRVLACGPLPMLKAVAGVCKERGFPCFVSMEERMACGIGACLVCACAVGGEYLRCCKDGPVFDASEVDWT
jgi:dihydroorotate dehydrogenase electron transfer subunit